MLTYCTNIHPGETWDETFAQLRGAFLTVRQAIAPEEPFPIGLRLSARAARELDGDPARRFADWCAAERCFVPTLNGFPYGEFHGTVVKDAAYLPDWRSPERVAYTKRLADLLFGWLPQGVMGSISTVPIGFRGHLAAADEACIRDNLLAALTHLDGLRQRTGKDVVLALEPEPGCLLETADDLIEFAARLRPPAGLSDLLGICYDCCHQAVAFAEPAGSLARLADAGVRLGKVQVSSALRLKCPTREQLDRFCEPTYLHQVVVRGGDGALRRYDDVPDALRGEPALDGEWRIHFHVPVFAAELGDCGTTRFFLEELLPLLGPEAPLEVETYSWEALPAGLRTGTVEESIVRELRWVRERLDEAHRRP